MIVECESCHTRFRLDESRIPATGAKVRCSRCKTAFVVKHPSATREDVIDEVVAEATGPGAARAPDATRDLVDASGPDDEKWEFDEEPRAGAAAGAQAPARAPRAGDTDAGDDLDALGSPEGWDLLAGAARKVAQEARFEAPSAEPAPAPRARREEPAVSPPARSVESALAAAAAESAAPPARDASEPPGRLGALREAAQAAVDGGVWIAAAALCAAGLALGLSPRSVASAPPPPAIAATLGRASVDVSVRSFESAVGGVLTVVRGQLPAGARASRPERLRVRWLDAQGKPIPGASALAGPPLGERQLRELGLARLRAEHEAHAAGLAAGGAFEAVFEALPPGASGISLAREPVPVVAPEVTQQVEATAPATTASSPPTARPSSE